MAKQDITLYIQMFLDGVRVHKTSGKPFKSTLKVNTVRGLVKHPKTGRLCFLFVEDETYVECQQCETFVE